MADRRVADGDALQIEIDLALDDRGGHGGDVVPRVGEALDVVVRPLELREHEEHLAEHGEHLARGVRRRPRVLDVFRRHGRPVLVLLEGVARLHGLVHEEAVALEAPGEAALAELERLVDPVLADLVQRARRVRAARPAVEPLDQPAAVARARLEPREELVHARAGGRRRREEAAVAEPQAADDDRGPTARRGVVAGGDEVAQEERDASLGLDGRRLPSRGAPLVAQQHVADAAQRDARAAEPPDDGPHRAALSFASNDRLALARVSTSSQCDRTSFNDVAAIALRIGSERALRLPPQSTAGFTFGELW